MRHKRALLFPLFIGICLIFVSCIPAVGQGSTPTATVPEEPTTVTQVAPVVIITSETINSGTPFVPSPQVLPFLSEAHAGWKNTDCETCHTLPPKNHNTSVTWECATCHGGNGACKSNGVNVSPAHNKSDPCTQCHQEVHGFTQAIACVTCHYAIAGTVDCSLGSGEGSEAETLLSPASYLSTGCVNWPGEEISDDNRVSHVSISLPSGNAAVDFTLKDVDGGDVTLSKLLKEKPVLLVLGGFTCESFRQNLPLLNQLAAKAFDSTRSYADALYFVMVNVIEPSPQPPDLSPYSAQVMENQYSSVRQPRTYDERLAVAREIKPLLEGNQLLLVDDLNTDGLNNPLWCTYGPACNAAFLIRQDGVIQTAQLWLDVEAMQVAIDELLK